jgi:predicted DNA-binding transcriptional regulator AlpA
MDAIQTDVSNRPVGLLDDFMTEAVFSAELKIGKQTARRWEREKRGPRRVKIGARVFYYREAVRDWLRNLASADERALKKAQAGLKNARKNG